MAHKLENERAVILPDVSKIFRTQYLAADSNPVNEHTTLESSERTVNVSSKWLMRQLTVHLYPHIASKCVHKKFGTLIYKRGGGDLSTSLSWALGARKYEQNEEAYQLYIYKGWEV